MRNEFETNAVRASENEFSGHLRRYSPTPGGKQSRSLEHSKVEQRAPGQLCLLADAAAATRSRTMSRGFVSRTLASVMLLVAQAVLTTAIANPVRAAPGDPPGRADVTLTWPSLGLEPGLVLGPNTPTTVTVPIPDGLTAVRLQGTFRQAANVGAGYLEIDDGDGRLLAAVDLPVAGPAQPVTPFDVDLSAVRVRASSVDLSFTVRPADNANGFCGPLQQVALGDLATVFTGDVTPPTTVANFFAPVLQQVSIYAPADADGSEQQAVLTLVSTFARLYRLQPLAIKVINQQRGAVPPPAPALARVVVVERGEAGLAVENPGNPGVFLRISGRGDEISTQVSLLVTQLQTLAQVAAVRVDQAAADAGPSGDTRTFSQLKLSGKTDVLRTGSVTVGVDRAALGPGRFDSIQVHLLADYTPVPKDDAAAVVVRSNGVVVYRASLDDTGVLDATFTVTGQAIGQGVNLVFALTYTPHEVCGPLMAPITFQINPSSTFTMHRGGLPLDGFGALPSEFSSNFVVALDGSSPNQLGYAARVVAAVARLSTAQLTPRVVDLATAVDATSGALIVANSAAVGKTSLNPPIGGDGKALDVRLPTELRVNIDEGLGSIQAFADRPRNRSVVLVTTTGAWTLVEPLFAYLDGLSGGWAGLSGDVLAAGAAGIPTDLAIRSGDDDVVAQPATTKSSAWLPVGIGITVAAVVVILGAALLARRRRATK